MAAPTYYCAIFERTKGYLTSMSLYGIPRIGETIVYRKKGEEEGQVYRVYDVAYLNNALPRIYVEWWMREDTYFKGH